MSECLYEGLRAVGLQHHFHSLRCVGIRSLSHLTVLTLEDFRLLGITNMDDRTRLFHLIQQLRTLDPQTLLQAESEDGDHALSLTGTEEEEGRCDSHRLENTSLNNLSTVCRELDFSSETTSETIADSTCSKSEKFLYTVSEMNSFTWDCDEMNSLIEKHFIRNVNKDDYEQNTNEMKPKQKSKKSSRRKSHKPERERENVKLQTQRRERSCPTENTTAPPNATTAPPTHNTRRSGEPRIWVCVRKRPLTPVEERRQETDVVTSAGESCMVHERRAAVDLTQYERQHKFFFDRVFGENCSNEDVYERTALPLLLHTLQGGSATCFAYGQTGAGKTHTMLGSSQTGSGPGGSGGGFVGGAGGGSSGGSGRESDRSALSGELGLYALAAQDLFSLLSSSPSLAHLSVFVSFFEIYCGQLYDLLQHRKRLFAREDGQRVVHISGLCHRRVDSVQSLLQVICRGSQQRTQGCSGVNPVSSRSHALLQIQLRGAGPREAGSQRGAESHVHGRMWFVDLAGSERASDSRDPDRRSRAEGAEINQSLLALKECIRSLDQEQSHTPFRQSKLTQVLKDSFVGDSLTCMIANISPGHSSTEHTLNTLRYADRVKELRGHREQRRGRRSRTAPSPKQTQSSVAIGGRCRGSSPPKKPRTVSTVTTKASPVRKTQDSSSFLCSTPKNQKYDQEKRRKRPEFDWISPVQRQTRLGQEDEEHKAPEPLIQAPKQTQNKKMHLRELENEPQQGPKSDEFRDQYFKEQDKRRHLRLYHQQLQQFDPLLTSTGLASPKSEEKNSNGFMLESATGEILGPSRAHINQVQPCLSNSALKNGKSRDLKDLVDGTGAIMRKNCAKNDRKTQTVENGGAKWAWVSGGEDVSGKRLNFDDDLKSRNTRRGFSAAFCDSRAPAERPLSPSEEHSDSLLTLSDLNRPRTSWNSEEIRQCSDHEKEQSSVNMEPLQFSMLDLDQEPVSGSWLKPKHGQEVSQAVCSVVWEPEEGAEESYLEVPPSVCSSMVPWAIRFHSQPQGGGVQSITPAVQPVSALDHVLPDHRHKGPHDKQTQGCPKSQKSTAPPPGLSGNSSSETPQRGERMDQDETTAEWMSENHFHVVQAHLETLKELELLWHREGALLLQHPDMSLGEYVEQLEQIMKRKALCVQSLRSHLQPYLKSTSASTTQH